jgi:DNA processing protein
MCDSEKFACIKLARLLSPVKANLAVVHYGTALNALEEILPLINYQQREIYDKIPDDLDHCIAYYEPAYPKLLNDIPDKPLVVYWNGAKKLLEETDSLIAMVGTRKPSSYGVQVVNKFVSEAVSLGLITISGLAFGIDCEVHKSTLNLAGKTIAVLGTGVVKASPMGNKWLYDRVIDEGGLILSEYYDLSNYNKWVFPRRNRIIAGLTNKLIVIEAQNKSGALITANLATDYNRDVFVTPGSIFNINSEGCNNAARSLKAQIITSIYDIIPHKDIAGEGGTYLAGGKSSTRMNTYYNEKQLRLSPGSMIDDMMAAIGESQLKRSIIEGTDN